jgi:hypothetical protein
MRHLRRDYDGVQDSSGKIPADEPVFVIRGKDITAPIVINYWASIAEQNGVGPEMVEAVRQWARAISTWQDENKAVVKVPDVDSAMLKPAYRTVFEP